MLPSIAAERRQNVAPGASPGFSFETISAPEGRKSSRNLSPLIGNRSGDDEAREE